MTRFNIIMIFTLLAFISYAGLTKNPPITVSRNGDKYILADGRLTFKIPKTWSEMKDPKLLDNGFLCGFSSDSINGKAGSYFLIQYNEMKIDKAQKNKILANNYLISNIEEVKEYIKAGKYRSNPELYDKTHDVFLYIQEEMSSNSVMLSKVESIMIKKFDSEGSFTIHYYCHDLLSNDIEAINEFVGSLKSLSSVK